MPDLVETTRSLQDYLLFRCGASFSPKIPQYSAINFQKAGTFPFCVFLMWFYGNWSIDAVVYTSLHGSYGLCWLLKHLAFPDPNFNGDITIVGVITMYAVCLGLYWLIPYFLIANPPAPASPLLLGSAITLHTLGVVIMIASDAQKYFVLRVKKELIDYGMFSRVRHPNYTGEIMLYSSYALLSRNYLSWIILIQVWIMIFAVNIIMKERSMSRYPSWKSYVARTNYLIPGVF